MLFRAFIWIFISYIYATLDLSFSISALFTIWAKIIICCGACSVHCRMFNSIPGLHPRDACHPSPPRPSCAQYSQGVTSPLAEHHCSGLTLLLWQLLPVPDMVLGIPVQGASLISIYTGSAPCTWVFVSIPKHRREVKLYNEVMWHDKEKQETGARYLFSGPFQPKCPTVVPEIGTHLSQMEERSHSAIFWTMHQLTERRLILDKRNLEPKWRWHMVDVFMQLVGLNKTWVNDIDGVEERRWSQPAHLTQFCKDCVWPQLPDICSGQVPFSKLGHQALLIPFPLG